MALCPAEDTKFSFCIIVPRMNLAGMVDYFFISLIIKQNRSRDIFYCSFFVDNKKTIFFPFWPRKYLKGKPNQTFTHGSVLVLIDIPPTHPIFFFNIYKTLRFR